MNEDFGGLDCISVDESSGRGSFHISVAGLLDQGDGPIFNLELSCQLDTPRLDLFPAGQWALEWYGFTSPSTVIKLNDLTLANGQKISCSVGMDGLVRGINYLVDARNFIKAKIESVKKENPSGADISENNISVILNSGLAQVFELVNINKTGSGTALLKKLVLPSGKVLQFTWSDPISSPRVTTVSDEAGELIRASWKGAKLVDMAVFPNTSEALRIEGLYGERTLDVIATGAGVLAKKLTYKLFIAEEKLSRLELVREHGQLADGTTEELKDVALFTYKDGKIASYGILHHGQSSTQLFTAKYAYADDPKTSVGTTIITCSQGTVKSADGKEVVRELGRYEYKFQEGRLISSRFDVNGEIITMEYKFTVADSSRCTELQSVRKVNGIVVDEAVLGFDVCGHLIKRQQGDLVTEWTYFNDYDVYNLEEKKKRESTINMGNWPGQWVQGALDYANPIGWGFLAFGDQGMTWYSVLHTTVTLSHTGTDYAKETFQLPVDINYPGNSAGFSSCVESELVTRVSGGKTEAISLTYYGYEKFVPVAHREIARTHVLVPTFKLTVFEPEYERVDISAKQLEIARRWSKAYSDSLSQQLKTATEGDDKAYFQQAIDNLETCLKAQSKLNGIGFKLTKPWSADAMRAEELTYEVDKKNAGFGRVKASTAYALSGEGKKVDDSVVVTSFKYTRGAETPRVITITTELKTADAIVVGSSMKRSELTGRLYEVLDNASVKKLFSYNESSMLTKQEVFQGDQLVSAVDFTVTPVKGGKYLFERKVSGSDDWSRTMLDIQGRICETWETDDGKTWLQLSGASFDDSGQLTSFTQYDYGVDGKNISQHITNYEYREKSVACVSVLKNGEGRQVDKQTTTITYGADFSSITHGDFKLERSLDRATRKIITTTGVMGSNAGMLRVEALFNEDGQLSLENINAVSADKQNLIGSSALTYGRNGLLSRATRKSGDNTFEFSYEYDRYGRLLKQDDNGVVIGNRYSARTLLSIATEASIQEDGGKIVLLGSQTLDGLGRVKTRTVNGVQESFSYKQASRWSEPIDLQGPEAMKGYSSEWDSAKLTYTQICPVRDTLDGSGGSALSTAMRYSRNGRLLSMTDVAGYDTDYTYDAYGRLSALCNNACKTSFVYGDDGSLKQEIIEDVLEKVSMTVTYAYDVMGHETSRTFTCEGMATHTLVRELFPDGRLIKSILKVGDKEHSSDQYTYDARGRLTAWSATGKSVPFGPNPTIIEQTFNYDNLGNVIKTQPKAKPDAAGYQWKPDIKREFSAEKPGLLIKHGTEPIPGDERGRWTKGGLRYYPNGKLQRADGSSGSAELLFGYDGQGRLRGMFQQGGNYSARGFQFHYRGGNVYARSQATTNDHVWGSIRRRDLILLNDSPSCYVQEVRDNNKRSASSFELRDAAGSIFASVQGKNTNYYFYPPYGAGGFQESSHHWLGFKGEAILANDTYYPGSTRIYDPVYLSFQAPDSWSPFGDGGPAAYAYCAGDPVNYHDPSGHQVVAQYSRKATGTLLETKEFRIGLAAAGLLTAPFTGGTSLGLAVAVTGLAVVSSGFDIASIVLEDSDPELAETLKYVGLGLGVASMVGAAIVTKFGARGATGIATRRSGSEMSRTAEFGNAYRSVPASLRGDRAPLWHQVTMPGSGLSGGDRHIWSVDTSIRGRDLKTPLGVIGRRQSTSDIHIYSGVHGNSQGNNWIDIGAARAKVMRSPTPAANERVFYKQDLYDYQTLEAFSREPLVKDALSQRQIFIHDLDPSILTEAELSVLEQASGHHIHAFCYSRNDERLLYKYYLSPVVSYVKDPSRIILIPPGMFAPPNPRYIYDYFY